MSVVAFGGFLCFAVVARRTTITPQLLIGIVAVVFVRGWVKGRAAHCAASGVAPAGSGVIHRRAMVLAH
eukprot:15438340-Alexandrium_andersonii.AAC.1